MQDVIRERKRLLYRASALALVMGSAGMAQNAVAGVGEPVLTDSLVVTSSGDIGGGERQYDYTVFNISDLVEPAVFVPEVVVPPGFEAVIVDWELPFFDDAGIRDIQAPPGWLFAIETVGQANAEQGWGGIAGWQQAGDPWNNFLNDLASDGITPIDNGLTDSQEDAFLNVTQVVHWYIAPDFFDNAVCNGSQLITVDTNEGVPGCNWGWDTGAELALDSLGIFPFDSLGGFGFIATAPSDIPAPYQASWFLNPVATGDPPFPGAGNPPNLGLPLSPILQPQVVPEPGSVALLALGLGGLAWARRRRTKAG